MQICLYFNDVTVNCRYNWVCHLVGTQSVHVWCMRTFRTAEDMLFEQRKDGDANTHIYKEKQEKMTCNLLQWWWWWWWWRWWLLYCFLCILHIVVRYLHSSCNLSFWHNRLIFISHSGNVRSLKKVHVMAKGCNNLKTQINQNFTFKHSVRTAQ